jgi:hypothetical protein
VKPYILNFIIVLNFFSQVAFAQPGEVCGTYRIKGVVRKYSSPPVSLLIHEGSLSQITLIPGPGSASKIAGYLGLPVEVMLKITDWNRSIATFTLADENLIKPAVLDPLHPKTEDSLLLIHQSECQK